MDIINLGDETVIWQTGEGPNGRTYDVALPRLPGKTGEIVGRLTATLLLRSKDGHSRLRLQGSDAEALDGAKIRFKGAEGILLWRAKRSRAVAKFDREQTVIIIGAPE